MNLLDQILILYRHGVFRRAARLFADYSTSISLFMCCFFCFLLCAVDDYAYYKTQHYTTMEATNKTIMDNIVVVLVMFLCAAVLEFIIDVYKTYTAIERG